MTNRTPRRLGAPDDRAAGPRRVSDGCPSDLMLDRLHAGELGDGGAEVERHLAACPACARRDEELRARRERFLAEAPLERLSFETLERVERSRKRTLWRLSRQAWVLNATAALIIVATAVFLSPRATEGPTDGGTAAVDNETPKLERRKGSLALLVDVRRGGRTFPATPGGVLHPGDALQFRFTDGATNLSDRHGAVLSVDGAGDPWVYLPVGGESSVPLDPRGAPAPTAGPSPEPIASAELDDVLGDERLVGVVCPEPFALAPLKAALAAAEPGDEALRERLPLAAGCAVASFPFRKVQR